jgi:hypothetical protein
MTDQEPIAAAILAALNAALAAEAVTLTDFADVAAYDRDGVPGEFGNEGTVPQTCMTIRLQFADSGPRRSGTTSGVDRYFLDVGYRARSVQGCRALRRIAQTALRDQFVAGFGPFTLNDETQPIDDDADWGWYGVDTFAFA